MIQPERVRVLNDKPIRRGDYVLYWMQAAQRGEDNLALDYAVRKANEWRLPVVAYFGLTDRFPEANLRHYAFLIEGLSDARTKLERSGIRLVVRLISPERGAVEMSERAALVVVDRGYLRIQKAWRAKAAANVDCPLVQVEADVVVPVETASLKEEWSAATLRPKVRSHWDAFLSSSSGPKPAKSSLEMDFDSIDLEDRDALLGRMAIDRSVPPAPFFRGGTDQAKTRLKTFVAKTLDHFAELRNIPTLDSVSHLSPYLHFGQISALSVARRVAATRSPGRDAFLEELVIRRELSMNFVNFNPAYDAYEGIPAWARKTLAAHAGDDRPVLYDLATLEAARTEDPYWNAAQNEMKIAGKMHGTMRMYWGKKILEWSPTPEAAFCIALALNNRYELDGRDPNGYAGVSWCFGRHDRPWGERKIFGMVRFMNAAGLRRKFDADAYVRKIASLTVPAEP